MKTFFPAPRILTVKNCILRTQTELIPNKGKFFLLFLIYIHTEQETERDTHTHTHKKHTQKNDTSTEVTAALDGECNLFTLHVKYDCRKEAYSRPRGVGGERGNLNLLTFQEQQHVGGHNEALAQIDKGRAHPHCSIYLRGITGKKI